jgi:hypothetical protein
VDQFGGEVVEVESGGWRRRWGEWRRRRGRHVGGFS